MKKDDFLDFSRDINSCSIGSKMVSVHACFVLFYCYSLNHCSFNNNSKFVLNLSSI